MKLFGFIYDGVSTMKGMREGLSTKSCRHAPHLLDNHCIVHMETLVVNDASSHFLEFQCIEKFANNIY